MNVVRAILLGAIAGALLLLAPAGSAAAADLEPIGSFDEPIYVTSDPGDGNRLFVVQRRGQVIEVDNGASSVFADLSGLVACPAGGCAGERGLLSIALAPDFHTSGRLFADYASEADEQIHVVELVASGGSALLATPRTLLEIPHPESSNHYAGQLQFGPEGNLFVATGDGGGANDEHHNAQDPESLLGKILRLDPDPSATAPYTVPAGNPLVGVVAPGAAETIWSLGLRNPFRFSFDRAGGGIWIGDVGQSAREEIDFAAAPGFGGGANYGWNCLEGSEPGPATDPQCASLSAEDFTAPVFEYPHEGGCAAVIGGYVVRDPGLTGLYGRYLYGDLCAAQLRSFDPADPYASDRAEPLSVANLNSFGEDACGRLYAVSGSGAVSRLVGDPPTACASPPTATVPVPLRPAYAGIKAFSRHVLRGDRALITVWISPCSGRAGERVRLLRGGRGIGWHHLSRVCTARFRPRIRHRSRFRAVVEAGGGFEATISRRLTIKPRRIHHRRHRHHRRKAQ